MVAAGVAVRVQALFAQGVDLCQQVARSACHVVRAQQSDDGRDTRQRVACQRHRRDPSPEACFTAPAGDVHVTVDQAGNQPQSGEIDFGRACSKRRGQCREILAGAHPENRAAAEQEGLQAEGAGCVDVGVSKEKHVAQVTRRGGAVGNRHVPAAAPSEPLAC